MIKFHIQKEPLQPQFLGLNIVTTGQAAGKLKLCGLKLYLYLMSNADGFTWTMNPAAYANWLGIEDYAKSGRSVRKAIDDGIKDLVENGYIQKVGDSYQISETACFVVEEKEQIVPKNQSSKSGTNCSSVEAEKELKVPNSEQTVPLRSAKGTKSTESGTNCSDLLKALGL